MARSRRGSFGLQPRVAPNVTGQIVALAREYVAKRDSNIMDAWRSGGTFEGKKATDDMVLAYWNERSKGLSKDDPDYENARNQVMQLQYAVAQSKADVLHVQGKMSDNEYAQFFIRWAKKVPANSEFYRTLQKDAAQLIESAKAKSRAAGDRAKTEAFNAFVKGTTAKDIAIGEALTGAISDLSKATGLNVTGNGEELLSLLTQNVKANPDQYRRLLDSIKAADPHWDGQLTPGYFSTHIKQATAGYDLIADRASKAGFVSAYASATQGESAMSSWGQNLKVWPVATTYSQAENSFLRVWNDPNASQMDKQAAAAGFSARLASLAATPGIDAGSKTMIEADAQRLLGQDAGDNPSFGAAMLGRPGVDPTMTMKIGAWAATTDEMHKNPLAWGYAPVDANGQFDPTGRGPLGMVPAGSIPPGAQAVVVPQANGQAVMAMVMPHSVYTTDPNNPNGSPKLAGYQISYNVGGKAVQMWGYMDAQNVRHWSLNSPVAEGAQTAIDNKGDVYVTPRSSAATDPIARAAQLDQQFGTHIADQLRAQQAAGAPLGNVSVTVNDPKVKDATGQNKFTLKYDNGVFTASTTQDVLDAKTGQVLSSQTTPVAIDVASPQNAAFSPSLLTAGSIAGITFDSPLQASVRAASSTQSADQVSKFVSDPAFQQAFLSQTMQTLGTQNPFDPRIASAWQKITTPTSADQEVYRNSPMSAASRDDLAYPGQVKAAQQGQLNINFGKSGELRLPGLPSYLQNQNVNLGALGNVGAAAYNGLASMLPSLGLSPIPPQQPTGSPAPTVTPTATPTSITPTPVTTPTALVPTPVAAPTATGGSARNKAL